MSRNNYAYVMQYTPLNGNLPNLENYFALDASGRVLCQPQPELDSLLAALDAVGRTVSYDVPVSLVNIARDTYTGNVEIVPPGARHE